MGIQRWVDPVSVSAIDGPVVANTGSEVSILDPGTSNQLPGNYWYPGKTIRCQIRGRISNIVTTPGTLTIRLRWGTTATGTVMVATQAFTINTTATTNVPFWLDLLMTCRTSGISSTFMLMGSMKSIALGSGATIAEVMIPTGNPAVSSSADTSSVGFINPTVVWSIANSGNSIQTTLIVIEGIN